MYFRVIFLSAFVFLSISENSYSANCGDFIDADDYKGEYCKDVDSLKSQGLINGYDDGTFRYGDTLSRREMMKMVVLAKVKREKVQEYKKEILINGGKYKCFTDVDINEELSDYICYAKDKLGIIDGYKDGSFRPGDLISYGEASKMILLSLSGGERCWKSYSDDSLVHYTNYMNNILKKKIDKYASVPRDFFAHMLNNSIQNKKFIELCLNDNDLLGKFSPLMAFYANDRNPVPIDAFIKHSILYTIAPPVTDVREQIIGFGENLPDSVKAKVIINYDYKEDYASYGENILPEITNSKKFSENKIFDLTGKYFFDFRNGEENGGKDYEYNYCDYKNCYQYQIDKNISFDPNSVSSSYEKTIYGRIVRSDDKIYLQYFFFYLMNDWNGPNTVNVGFHEGDWEGMVIELDRNQRPLRMGVSIHGRYEYSTTKDWGNVNKVDAHPVVYIGYGGHPTYFEKGITKICTSLIEDKHDRDERILYYKESTEDGKSINDKSEKIAYSIINIEDKVSTKYWFISNIYWGEDYKDSLAPPVASPGSVYSHDPERWSAPGTWLDTNQQWPRDF